MLITKEVKIKVNNKTKNHYLKLGYILDNGFFNIKTDDLTTTSRVKVKSQCDYCNSIKELPFYLYRKNISYNNKFACSSKCGSEKRKEISVVKYGVNSPSKLDNIKEKSKKTNIDKYGKEFYMSSDEFKQKSKKKNLEKYGFEIPMQSEEVKERLKQTNLEKYGCENTFQSDEIKEKIKSNNLEKYGYKYYQSTNEFKDKFKNTCLINFGVDHPTKSKFILDKIKNSNLERYGVEFYMSTVEFKDKSKKTNLEKYGNESPNKSEILRKINYEVCKDINYIRYEDKEKISVYYCNKGHEFYIKSDNYISRKNNNISICTICNPIDDLKSIKEKELFEFISSVYTGEIIQSYRDGLEIDIYLPELNLGFEFNGLYFHSDKFKEKNYHIRKTNYFSTKNIKIFHIWQDDWTYKQDIVKSMVVNKLNQSFNKIGARKCKIKEINDNQIIRKFLDENHIQGFVGSKIKIGLFYNDLLISIMCFDQFEGRKKMKNGFNLNRFCNKIDTNVIGGASKLLKYFIEKYDPERIISYADKDWSVGDLYEKIGFIKISESNPDYKYILNGKRTHKSNFRKSQLKKKFNLDTSNKNESELIKELDILKIYDCGKIKYEYLKMN